MNRRVGRVPADYRVLAAIVTVTFAAGVVSSVAGIAGYLIAAVLLATALAWLLVAMLRREQRIRTRLADPRTHPHRSAVHTMSGVS